MRTFSFGRIATVQIAIFLAGLVVIELALRLFFPLPPHGGEYRDSSGNAVRIARDADTLHPRLDVRHTASEFSAQIRTSALGYRRMSNESTAPDFLFLGDSFTFGHGVSDEEVFSEVFCRKRRAACLNLGRSGTHTFAQVRLLRHAILTHQLRPKRVVLSMLAACWLGGAGNDLGDNLVFHRDAKRTVFQGSSPSVVRAGFVPAEILRTLQGWIGHFEITKRVMVVASSRLKGSVYVCSNASELEAAASATSRAFGELVVLAEQYDFQLDVVVIHPFQDLAGGFRATEAVVTRALLKRARCIVTAKRFRTAHYYPYDGHFNASGHANLAAILDEAIDSAPNTCESASGVIPAPETVTSANR